MSAASVAAHETQGSVILNMRQSGVHSYGVAQPTYWHTVFSGHFFHKSTGHVEVSNVAFSESDLERAMSLGWKTWSAKRVFHTSGGFLNFTYFWSNRQLLQNIYRPNFEVQRWVNDAAVELSLASAEGVLTSSLHGVNRTSSRLSKHKSQFSAYKVEGSCPQPPAPCDRPIHPLQCSVAMCKKNLAVHIRLEDRSRYFVRYL